MSSISILVTSWNKNCRNVEIYADKIGFSVHIRQDRVGRKKPTPLISLHAHKPVFTKEMPYVMDALGLADNIAYFMGSCIKASDWNSDCFVESVVKKSPTISRPVSVEITG